MSLVIAGFFAGAFAGVKALCLIQTRVDTGDGEDYKVIFGLKIGRYCVGRRYVWFCGSGCCDWDGFCLSVAEPDCVGDSRVACDFYAASGGKPGEGPS